MAKARKRTAKKVERKPTRVELAVEGLIGEVRELRKELDNVRRQYAYEERESLQHRALIWAAGNRGFHAPNIKECTQRLHRKLDEIGIQDEHLTPVVEACFNVLFGKDSWELTEEEREARDPKDRPPRKTNYNR